MLVYVGIAAVVPHSISAEVKPQPKAGKTVPPRAKAQPQKAPTSKPEIKPEAKPDQPVQAETAPPTALSLPAEPMGENDRLEFMRTDDIEQPQEPSSSGLMIKSVGALALVIALLFVGTWTLRKLGFGGKKPTVEAEHLNLAIVSSIPMGGGRTLSTIQFGDRILLVGATAQNISLLAEEVPFDNEFSRRPRSVADLLAGDDRSFEDELELMTGRWEASERVS